MLDAYKQTINISFTIEDQNVNRANSNNMDDYIRRFRYVQRLHLDRFDWTYKTAVLFLLLSTSFLFLIKQAFGRYKKQQRLGDNDFLRRYRRMIRTKGGYIGIAQRQV